MNQKIVSLESNILTKPKAQTILLLIVWGSIARNWLIYEFTRIQQNEQLDPAPKHEALYFLSLCTITLLVH